MKKSSGFAASSKDSEKSRKVSSMKTSYQPELKATIRISKYLIFHLELGGRKSLLYEEISVRSMQQAQGDTSNAD